MATTATGSYVSDNSSFANFKSWATAISAALAAFGWVQSNDTGQVVWTASVMTGNITAVALVSGTTYRYTYTAITSGPGLRVGMSLAITGFTGGNTGNNGAALVITSLAGGAGTFDVTNATGVACSGTAASGTTTAQAAVPSSAYVYEIWMSADSPYTGTLPIYLKMAYGYSATSPRIQVSVGTSSNGAGTINGSVIAFAPWTPTTNQANQGATTFPCFFSGTAGEFRMYMWQSSSLTTGVLFGIERSKDSGGSTTASYFTVLFAQNVGGTAGISYAGQQTITASAGAANVDFAWISPSLTSGSGTGIFNGTVAAFPVFPSLGLCGNPMLGWMTCCGNDVSDGSTVTVASLYAGTHTFVAAKGTVFSVIAGAKGTSLTPVAILMRFE